MEKYTAVQKELIGALVGLARSLDETNSNYSALASIVRGLKAIDSPTSEEIRAVRDAKQRAVPDCEVCQNPCGRTSDYDLDELKPETAELKYRLVESMRAFAREVLLDENNYKDVLDKFSEGLFAVGYDYFNEEQLGDIIRKVSEQK